MTRRQCTPATLLIVLGFASIASAQLAPWRYTGKLSCVDYLPSPDAPQFVSKTKRVIDPFILTIDVGISSPGYPYRIQPNDFCNLQNQSAVGLLVGYPTTGSIILSSEIAGSNRCQAYAEIKKKDVSIDPGASVGRMKLIYNLGSPGHVATCKGSLKENP